MEDEEQRLKQARTLTARLERLSADSYWAHRASGLRGSLLRSIESIENGPPPEERATAFQRLEGLIERAFIILTNAAREIRTPEL